MTQKSSHKLYSKKLLVSIEVGVILLITLAVLIFFVKPEAQKQHDTKVKVMQQRVVDLTKKINAQRDLVSVEQAFETSTNGVALPIRLMDVDQVSYTDSEQEVWAKCYSGLDKFGKELPRLREKAAVLSGNDLNLYNTWLDNAEKLSQWSVCHKSSFYTNEDKADNADVNMSNVADRISGRVKELEADLDKDNKDLQTTKDSKYFLWW